MKKSKKARADWQLVLEHREGYNTLKNFIHSKYIYGHQLRVLLIDKGVTSWPSQLLFIPERPFSSFDGFCVMHTHCFDFGEMGN